MSNAKDLCSWQRHDWQQLQSLLLTHPKAILFSHAVGIAEDILLHYNVRYLLCLYKNLVFYIENAFAYIGPGMGGGILAATIGIIVAIFAAFFGLLWFPIKRMIYKFQKKNDHNNNKRNELVEKKE